MLHINDLPVDAFLEIIARIDGYSLGRCRRVCKKWHDCIDGIAHLWQAACEREFKYASKIAIRKCSSDCDWLHLYRNFRMWNSICSVDKHVREFYKFALHDKSHALDIECSVLPLRDTRGILLYDLNTLKYIPVVVPEKNCLKIGNNDIVTVLLLTSGLMLQRTVNDASFMSEAFFSADNFLLTENMLYFHYKRNIFKCDLTVPVLASTLILQGDFEIKEMQYNNGFLHLFTGCGKIMSIINDQIYIKAINCPLEWIRQIKHISAIDDKNFVCYSRNLFKIETSKYQHLYLDFPSITALFFYGETVLIGTRFGEILIYRLSSQKEATNPIFETFLVLPDGKFAVQLDVCERKSGPVIVAATYFDIIVIEVNFFPNELQNQGKRTYTSKKLLMYKRLLRLKDRLHMY